MNLKLIKKDESRDKSTRSILTLKLKDKNKDEKKEENKLLESSHYKDKVLSSNNSPTQDNEGSNTNVTASDLVTSDTDYKNHEASHEESVENLHTDSKQDKEEESINYKQILLCLQQIYPIAFATDKTKIVPLKLSIHKDIKANTELMERLSLNKKDLSKFMYGYVMSESYLNKIIAGKSRYDLSGIEVGLVLKEHEENAIEMLELKQIKQKKRAQARNNQ